MTADADLLGANLALTAQLARMTEFLTRFARMNITPGVFDKEIKARVLDIWQADARALLGVTK